MTRSGRDYHELEVRDGLDPESILHAAIAHGEHVTRFEIAEPSIEDIFIEKVGDVSVEERSLAAAPGGQAR